MLDEITRRRREREIDRLTTRIRQLEELLSYNRTYYDPWRTTDLRKQVQRHQAELNRLGGASGGQSWTAWAATRTGRARTGANRTVHLNKR